MSELTNYIKDEIAEIRKQAREPSHPTLQHSADLMAWQIIALQTVLSKIEEISLQELNK